MQARKNYLLLNNAVKPSCAPLFVTVGAGAQRLRAPALRGANQAIAVKGAYARAVAPDGRQPPRKSSRAVFVDSVLRFLNFCRTLIIVEEISLAVGIRTQ